MWPVASTWDTQAKALRGLTASSFPGGPGTVPGTRLSTIGGKVKEAAAGNVGTVRCVVGGAGRAAAWEWRARERISRQVATPVFRF